MTFPPTLALAAVLWSARPLQAQQQVDPDTSKKVTSAPLPAPVPSKADDDQAKAAAAKIDDLQHQISELRQLQAGTPEQRERAKVQRYPLVLRTSTAFLNVLVVGSVATFTGSGIAHQEITLQKTTAPWNNEHLRNEYDKAKPWTDGFGALAVGFSFIFQNNGSPNTAKLLGGGGGLVMALGTILKAAAGTHEDKLLAAVGQNLDSLRDQVDQISLSRQAYDELEIRRTLANTYSNRADTLLVALERLRDTADVLAIAADAVSPQTPLNDVLAVRARMTNLIDKLFAQVTAYDAVVNFVDDYTENLLVSYGRYRQRFPNLAPQFVTGEAELTRFRTRFYQRIKRPWLDQLPRYRVALADLRTELRY